jgi:hypothetical protein
MRERVGEPIQRLKREWEGEPIQQLKMQTSLCVAGRAEPIQQLDASLGDLRSWAAGLAAGDLPSF